LPFTTPATAGGRRRGGRPAAFTYPVSRIPGQYPRHHEAVSFDAQALSLILSLPDFLPGGTEEADRQR